MGDRDSAVATPSVDGSCDHGATLPQDFVPPPLVEENDSSYHREYEMVVSDFIDCSVEKTIGQRHQPPSRGVPGPANEALHAYFVLLSSIGAFFLFALAFQKGRSGDVPREVKASVGRRLPPRTATKARLVRSISGTVAPVTAIGKGKMIQKQRTIDEADGKDDDDDVVVAPSKHRTIHSGPTASSSSDQESFLDDGDAAVKLSTKAERIRFLNARDGNVDDARDMLGVYLKWRDEMGLDAAAPVGGTEADVADCEMTWNDCARRAVDHHSSRNDPESASSPDDHGGPARNDPDRKLPCVAFLDPESSPNVVRTVDNARALQHLPARIDLTLAPGHTYALALALYLDATLDRNRTEKCCVLIDVRSGTGWANVPAIKLVSYIKFVSKMLNDLHPERLDKCILYPFPRVATAIWGMVRPFLDPDTARKVVLLAGSARTDAKPPMKGLLMHFEEGTVERLERRRLEQFHPPPS